VSSGEASMTTESGISTLIVTTLMQNSAPTMI
jgi:hypothetical protein